jgi:uncharacterized membrane protein YphA (DoxX/SURF4 family)
MSLEITLDDLHTKTKSNKWFRYFASFNRVALAAGFIPSGFTKIFDERFTSLSENHPMGHYLEALYHTGFYYPFIGYMQVIAAILLLIPRTSTLGALIYFPIILNICILSLAVGFEGSLISATLMVFANLYLICWDYDKLKYVLPFKSNTKPHVGKITDHNNNKFPIKFFIGVLITVILTILILFNAYTKMPRNTYQDCMNDCKKDDNTESCFDFCICIHQHGVSFDKCTQELKKCEKNR